MSDNLVNFIFSKVPDAKWTGWTISVLAINETDARNYMAVYHRGGTLMQKVVSGGTVKADCGAVTTAAAGVLSRKKD